MCGTGTLVYRSDRRVEIKASGCGCWSCPTCVHSRKANLEIRLKCGSATRWLTVTCNPKRGWSPANRRELMGKALPKLMRRIATKTGVKPEYAVVVEDTEKGEPHFHIMMRSRFISKRLLKKWWYELTSAFMVDIQLIKKPRDVARYMTKYMSKDPVKFGNSKRYWFSKGYQLPGLGGKGDERYKKGSCTWDRRYPEDVAWDWKRQGYYQLPGEIDRGWHVLVPPEVLGQWHEACGRAFSG